jgi:transglutaminase-like putative cysteine protease
MHIGVECEIALDFPEPAAVVLLLALHPSVLPAVRGPERLVVEPPVPLHGYTDVYGNRCARAFVPVGRVVFRHSAVVEDAGLPDPQAWGAHQHRVQDLPDDALLFLLASRYCEVDSSLKDAAWARFGHLPAGWPLVRAVCDFVHGHVRFDYLQARATRTAVEVYRERVGVCRDFTHLAVTLCRCLNVPARYCTGYLGDIGVPADPAPMDVSAWFEVFLGGRWHTLDARHNVPRIGRVLVARGRDAADVALTTAFGANRLDSFRVRTEEIPPPSGPSHP